MPVKLNFQNANGFFDCGKLRMIFLPFLWWISRHILVLILLVNWLRSLLLKQSHGIHLHRLKGSTFSFITSFSLLVFFVVRSRTLVVWPGVKELLEWQGVVARWNVLWLILEMDLLSASFLPLLFPGRHFQLGRVLSKDAFWSTTYAGSCCGTSLCDPRTCFVIIVFTQIWLESTVFLLLLKLSNHGVFILSCSVIDSFLGSLNYGLLFTRCHPQRLRIEHWIKWVFFNLLLLLIVPVFKLIFVLLLSLCMLIQSLSVLITPAERHLLFSLLLRTSWSSSTYSVHNFVSLLEGSYVWSILVLLAFLHMYSFHVVLFIFKVQTILPRYVHGFELLMN